MNKKYKILLFPIGFLLVGLFLIYGIEFEFKSCGMGAVLNEGNFKGYGDFNTIIPCKGYKKILSDIDDYLGVPVVFFSMSLIVLSLILLFLNNSIFKKWLKLSIPLAIFCWIIILITPVSSLGFLTPEREQVSIWMSSLFLIISIVMIVIWTIQEKRKSKK